jgi:hypothetical protein
LYRNSTQKIVADFLTILFLIWNVFRARQLAVPGKKRLGKLTGLGEAAATAIKNKKTRTN